MDLTAFTSNFTANYLNLPNNSLDGSYNASTHFSYYRGRQDRGIEDTGTAIIPTQRTGTAYFCCDIAGISTLDVYCYFYFLRAISGHTSRT